MGGGSGEGGNARGSGIWWALKGWGDGGDAKWRGAVLASGGGVVVVVVVVVIGVVVNVGVAVVVGRGERRRRRRDLIFGEQSWGVLAGRASR